MTARLIVYFPLADHSIATDLLDDYAEAGIDFVEFGWPAHDPYLDGPDVRASMVRASKSDPQAAFRAARKRLASRSDPPRALVMTYAEAGHSALIDTAFFEGVDAILTLAPPDDEIRTKIESKARDAGAQVSTFIPLPETTADIAAARRADCYVMLQAAPGVTGPRDSIDPSDRTRIAALRADGITAPIVLGFGVSNGEQARAAVECGTDGVVVGAAALRAAIQGREELAALLRNLRKGLDG
jgi:tryptophan synthase alpha chain